MQLWYVEWIKSIPNKLNRQKGWHNYSGKSNMAYMNWFVQVESMAVTECLMASDLMNCTFLSSVDDSFVVVPVEAGVQLASPSTTDAVGDFCCCIYAKNVVQSKPNKLTIGTRFRSGMNA